MSTDMTVTISQPLLCGATPSQLAMVNGRLQRLYPLSTNAAAVYPDWPGRNRHERRTAKARARRAS